MSCGQWQQFWPIWWKEDPIQAHSSHSKMGNLWLTRGSWLGCGKFWHWQELTARRTQGTVSEAEQPLLHENVGLGVQQSKCFEDGKAVPINSIPRPEERTVVRISSSYCGCLYSTCLIVLTLHFTQHNKNQWGGWTKAGSWELYAWAEFGQMFRPFQYANQALTLVKPSSVNPFPDVAGYIRHGHMCVFKKSKKNTVLSLATQNCFWACPEGCSTRKL